MSSLSNYPGATKMYQDLQKVFWWPCVKKEVVEFGYSFFTCHKSKIEHQKPSRLMQPLSIPKWKWDIIFVDFLVSFSNTTKGNDSIWVNMDRLTNSTRSVPIKISYLLQKLVEIYISEIVRLHGIPSIIVSDRDLRFMSRFWENLQESWGTKLRLSSAYHPQTDGKT